MNKYLFVINPVSGGLDKQELVNKAESFCSENSCDFRIFYTTGDDDFLKIKKEIENQKPDTLVVSGGDGTINMVVPLLLDFDLTLGLVPAGSANGLATEMGITLENTFETLSGQKTCPLDIVLLGNTVHMIHLADFGLNAMLVRRYEEEGRRGLIGYAISALKEIGTMEEPFEVKIKGDHSVTFQTKFLIIANASKYGTGFEVNPKGQLGDQKVELCILKEISPALIFDNLLEEESDDQANNFFEVLSGKSFQINLNKPIDFQSDGEYLGKKDQLDVKVLDKQVNVIVPE